MDIMLLLLLAFLFGGKAGAPGAAPAPAPAPVPPPFPGPIPIPVPVPGQPPVVPGPIPTAPPATPAPIPIPVPVPQAATYTIRSGDTAFGLAQRAVGDGSRWKEILSANPQLKAETINVPKVTKAHPEGENIRTTFIKPWQPGQTITVPPTWPPTF